MAYLPRPDPERVQHDLDGLLEFVTPDLTRARTEAERLRYVRRALFLAFEAGVDAQREITYVVISRCGLSIPTSTAPEPFPRANHSTVRPIASDLARILRTYRAEGQGEIE